MTLHGWQESPRVDLRADLACTSAARIDRVPWLHCSYLRTPLQRGATDGLWVVNTRYHSFRIAFMPRYVHILLRKSAVSHIRLLLFSHLVL